MWLIFGVHRTEIISSLDPKMKLLINKIVSKQHACTIFELEKVEAFAALNT